MFGEFIIIGGLSVISAIASKSLESMNKNKEAKFIDFTAKGGLMIYALKKLNDLSREINNFL